VGPVTEFSWIDRLGKVGLIGWNKQFLYLKARQIYKHVFHVLVIEDGVQFKWFERGMKKL
jgi:hypothetical protein